MISKKKSYQLYSTVSNSIMDARIKIAHILNDSKQGKEVDDILSYLCYQAPQKAVDLFKPKL